jgi:folylpolyglutamate synthase/dihydropteroate synthase
MAWRNGAANAAGFENPLDAVAAASKENDVVVVCGSLYLVGWVRSRLGTRLS